MEILFMAFLAIGLIALMSNVAAAIGEVICALMKYIILPFGLLLCICYVIKYGP